MNTRPEQTPLERISHGEPCKDPILRLDESLINRAAIFPPSIEDSKHYIFCFKNKKTAKKCLININEILEKNNYDKQPINLKYIKKNFFYKYQFKLSSIQYGNIKNIYRNNAKDPKKILGNNYFIKSIRSDENDYFRSQFIYGCTRTPKQQVKFTLRTSDKKMYTVDGTGIHKRAERKSQYSKLKKQSYSQPQAISMVTKKVHTPFFGHNKERQNKLVGVCIHKKDVLLSNRLYIYDGGTVARPYDFDDLKSAQSYHKLKVLGDNPVLFSKSNKRKFQTEILKKMHIGKFNEVLGRIRWNKDGSSFIAIASQTLEAKLLAQDRARILKQRLKDQARELGNQWHDSYEVPICFYYPSSLIHTPLYDAFAQAEDRAQAQSIYENKFDRSSKYANNDFEFLLAIEDTSFLLDETLETNESLIVKILRVGYVNIVQSLLEKASFEARAKVKFNVGDSTQALCNAVKSNDIELVTWLISKNLTVNDEALSLAIKNKNLTLIELVLNAGMQASNAQAFIDSALVIAAQKGCLDIVKKLIKAGANPNIVHQNGDSALTAATKSNRNDIVKWLLKKGADAYLADKNGESTLILAAKNGNNKLIKLLLKKGMCFNKTTASAKYFYYNSPLFAATMNKHNNIVKLLLNSGVNPDLPDKDGITPLMAACGTDALLTKMLLDHGANPNALTIHNKSALHYTIEAYKFVGGNHIDTIKLLLARGAIINLSESNQSSLIVSALKNVNTKYIAAVIPLLLQYGANPNFVGEKKQTAIAYVAKHAQLDIVKILLENNANPNGVDKHRVSALQHAVDHQDIEMVKILLEHGANDNNKILEKSNFSTEQKAYIKDKYSHIGSFFQPATNTSKTNKNPIHFRGYTVSKT